MKSFSERLRYLIDKKGITPYYLSEKTGISEAAISRLLNGKSIRPNIRTTGLLANYFHITEDWLLTGEGEMLKVEYLITQDIVSKKSVPFYNSAVTAGRSLTEIVGKDKPDGYINLPGAEVAESILPVTGFSMNPEILSGSLIGVRLMNNWETLNTARIYLIITRDDRMVKRIEHDPKDDSILWCLSTNYPRFKIYKEDIIEIHRVCFVYHEK